MYMCDLVTPIYILFIPIDRVKKKTTTMTTTMMRRTKMRPVAAVAMSHLSIRRPSEPECSS